MENNQSQNSEISGIDSIRPISNESFGHILPQQTTAISNAAAAAALSNYTRMLNFQNQLNLISLAGPTMELNPLALAWNNRSKSLLLLNKQLIAYLSSTMECILAKIKKKRWPSPIYNGANKFTRGTI